MLRPEDFDAVCPGGNGIFHPMLIKDGQIVGTWQRSRGPLGTLPTWRVFPGFEVDAAEVSADWSRFYPPK